jgi:large subunit ribosomal protein L7/L12
MIMTPRAILEEIKGLKVTELAELVKAIEVEFNVSAAAAVGVAVAAGPVVAAAAEKTEFKVTLKAGGAEALKAIKALRAVCPDLGLKEAKDAVTSAPFVVRESANKEDAEKIKKTLEEAGCTVELS